MSVTIILADALKAKIVRNGDYFLTTAPKDRFVVTTKRETGFDGNHEFKIEAGVQILWRWDGTKMLGEPTKEGLTLQGEYGLKNGPNVMHQIARELYELPGIFEQVRAYSLPEKTYLYDDALRILQEEKDEYRHPDDIDLKYWLASRCVDVNSTLASFGNIRVIRGIVNVYWLHDSGGYTNYDTCAVRPEAIPKSMLILETDGCDGTRSRPWICLGK